MVTEMELRDAIMETINRMFPCSEKGRETVIANLDRALRLLGEGCPVDMQESQFRRLVETYEHHVATRRESMKVLGWQWRGITPEEPRQWEKNGYVDFPVTSALSGKKFTLRWKLQDGGAALVLDRAQTEGWTAGFKVVDPDYVNLKAEVFHMIIALGRYIWGARGERWEVRDFHGTMVHVEEDS